MAMAPNPSYPMHPLDQVNGVVNGVVGEPYTSLYLHLYDYLAFLARHTGQTAKLPLTTLLLRPSFDDALFLRSRKA